MAKALRDGELDAALLLTEGAVAAIADGAAVQDREPLHRLAARLGHPRARGLAFPRGRRSRAALATRSAARLGVAPHGVRARARARVGPSSDSRSSPSAISTGAVDAFAARQGRRILLGKVHDEAARRRRAVSARRRSSRRRGRRSSSASRDARRGEPRAALMRAVALVLAEARALRTRARRGGRDRAALRARRRRRRRVAHRDALERARRRRRATTSARHARRSARSACCRAPSTAADCIAR